MVKLIGLERSSEMRQIEVLASDFESALQKLEELVPAGWDLLRVRI
jgi:hypothetical protein